MSTISKKEVSLRFASFISEELTSRKSKNDAFEILEEHKDAILEARGLRVSHIKIAKFLNDAGTRASVETVRQFCQKVLKETPKKRRKSVKGKVKKQVKVETKKETRPSGNKSKSNFRVAGDDL